MSSMDPVSSSYHSKGQRKASTTLDKKRTRGFMGHVLRNQNEADITIGSETETGMSDSDMEGPMGRRTGWTDRLSVVESVPEDVKAVFDEQIDVFWMPYAITLGKFLLDQKPYLLVHSLKVPNLRYSARLSPPQCMSFKVIPKLTY